MLYNRIIAKSVLFVFLFLSIVSCSQDSQKDLILKIAINAGPEGNAIELLAPEYKKAKIEIIRLPYQSLRQQLISALNDQQSDFDIVMIDDPWFPQLSPKLAKLNNISQSLIDDIIPSSLALCRSPYGSGELKALPFVGNTQLIFCRADILSELGLEKVPNQWEEFSSLVKKISLQSQKNNGKKVYGYAIRGRSGAPIVTDFLPIYWSLGGRLVNDRGNPTAEDIDGTILKKALMIYKSLKENSPPDAINFDWSEMTAAFTNGQAVFELNWPAAIPVIDSALSPKKGHKVWALALLPGSQGEPGTSMIGNWLLGIPNDSQKVEDSEAFIGWLMKQQGRVAGAGNPPTLYSVFKQLAKEPGKEYFSLIQKALEISTPRARTAKWAQIEDAVSHSVSGFLTEKHTTDEAINKMKSDIDKIF